jgi:hypothetical protein
MKSQDFTSEELGYMRRRSDRLRFGLQVGYPRSSIQWDAYLSLLEQKINTTRTLPNNFAKLNIGRKTGLTAEDIETALILRKVNDNIRKTYGIKQPSRSEITHEVAVLLRENTTKHIIKLDIKSFFESIPINELYAKLVADRKVSTLTLKLLSDFISVCKFRQFHGVPRGLNLSATLAELHVRNLDQKLREIDGVYHVNRYVDDIVVFCFKEKNAIEKEIKKNLVDLQLRINYKKYNVYDVHARCDFKCSSKATCMKRSACNFKASTKSYEMDLLGYEFVFKDINTDRAENPVITKLARKKIQRIKKRIYRSFEDYQKSGNFKMLEWRVKYLSGNHRLRSSQNRGKLRAGPYYSYMQCKESEPEYRAQLSNLDEFLRIHIAHASKVTAPYALSVIQALRLRNVTFLAAVDKKLTNKWPPSRIVSISECWKYG